MLSPDLRRSGIYVITNISTGKRYVGSTSILGKRWHDHRKQLRENRHHSILLQRSWNKYGPSHFSFEIVEFVDDKRELVNREQFWIDALEAANNHRGYNICPRAGSTLGRKMTEAQIEAIRRRPPSVKTPEINARISAAMKGVPKSADTVAKFRKRIWTQESREKASKAAKARPVRTGYKLGPRTAETKEKLSRIGKAFATTEQGREQTRMRTAARLRKMKDPRQLMLL